jgi:hypothetical protein
LHVKKNEKNDYYFKDKTYMSTQKNLMKILLIIFSYSRAHYSNKKKVPPHMPSNICQNYVPLVCPKLIYIGSSNNCHEVFGVGLI